MAGRRTSAAAGAPSRTSAARLMAVQALHQREVTGVAVDALAEEFVRLRLAGGEVDGVTYAPADRRAFLRLLRGVAAAEGELDALLDGALAGGWRAARLEPLLRVVMRCGAEELRAHLRVPPRVVVSEYADIAHAFYGGPEPGMVNAVLDRLARDLRGGC